MSDQQTNNIDAGIETEETVTYMREDADLDCVIIETMVDEKDDNGRIIPVENRYHFKILDTGEDLVTLDSKKYWVETDAERLTEEIPNCVIEALEESKYTLVGGVTGEWVEWNGRPEFSELTQDYSEMFEI